MTERADRTDDQDDPQHAPGPLGLRPAPQHAVAYVDPGSALPISRSPTEARMPHVLSRHMNVPTSYTLIPRSASLRTARPDVLRAESERSRVVDGTPEGARDLLRVSREMFVHAAFLYDLFTVAAAWSFLALEAALRDRLVPVGNRVTLGGLVQRAERRGLLNAKEAQKLGAGTELRNSFLHAQELGVLSPGTSQMLLAATHEAIANLYERPTESA